MDNAIYTAGFTIAPPCLAKSRPCLAKLQRRLGKLMMLTVLIAVLSFLFAGNAASAAIDVYEFDSPAQEAQYKALIEEFRCPKCQNQNLAGSDSQIAQDLKRKTYEMVVANQSDQQIREYMYERYGDYISYKPPVRPSTWILWFFPPICLLLLLGWWLWRNAKRSRQRLHTASPSVSLPVSPSMPHKVAVDTNNDVVNNVASTGSGNSDSHNSGDSEIVADIDSDIDNAIDSDIDAQSTLSDDERRQLDILLAKHRDSATSIDNPTIDNPSVDPKH